MTQPIAILLVEDNIDDVDVLRRYIRRAAGSFRVEIAYNGADALEKARVHPFDVVLVDQHLPDLPGEKLIARLREVVPELPAVMLTGHGDERLAVEVMKAGAYDYLRKDDLEPQVLLRTLHNVLERARLEAEVRRANERLLEWAIRDGLTGLYNHRHFQELLRTEFARALRSGRPLACLLLDLDHFKQVNDTYGHPFGDEVLKMLARTLQAEARKGDVIARYGGEEFVLALPDTDAGGAQTLAERICQRVAAEPFVHDGHTTPVTVSIGVSSTADPRVRSERELVKLADGALYSAKRQGRNRVCLADEPDGALGPITTPPPLQVPRAEMRAQVRRLFVDSLLQVLELAESGADHRDHSRRVADLATQFGRVLGMNEDELDVLQTAALLHDIGRVGISDTVWLKPGPLSDEERAKVDQHAAMGEQVLRRADFLERERRAIRHHHERWDGGGHPDGLAGEAIPLAARVIAICDGFEAMTAPRAWRGAFSIDEAMRTLVQGAGTVYDPELVQRFFEVVRQAQRTEERR